MRKRKFKSQSCLPYSTHNTFIKHCSTSLRRENIERSKNKNSVRCRLALTDLIVALLQEVAGPCHHHRGRRGGRCHRRMVVAPTSPPLPPPSSAPHHRMWRGPVPFPRLVGVLTNGALGPRRLSMGLPGPAVCHPRLGAVPQPGCTSPRIMRGKRREEKKKTMISYLGKIYFLICMFQVQYMVSSTQTH
jgi:hypothetical protein